MTTPVPILFLLFIPGFIKEQHGKNIIWKPGIHTCGTSSHRYVLTFDPSFVKARIRNHYLTIQDKCDEIGHDASDTHRNDCKNARFPATGRQACVPLKTDKNLNT